MPPHSSEMADQSNIKLALIQMTSGKTLEKNFDFLTEHIAQAAKLGATYVQSPENSLLMELNPKELARITKSDAYKDALNQLFLSAAHHKIWLHVGSVAIPFPENKDVDDGKFLFSKADVLVDTCYFSNWNIHWRK